jgi:hypothetical protein
MDLDTPPDHGLVGEPTRVVAVHLARATAAPRAPPGGGCEPRFDVDDLCGE